MPSEHEINGDAEEIDRTARLKTRFTDLSPADVRLIMLVKERFGVGEAASTLGISYESVKKARYRLRKKLELPEEDNLDSFIQSV